MNGIDPFGGAPLAHCLGLRRRCSVLRPMRYASPIALLCPGSQQTEKQKESTLFSKPYGFDWF